MYRAHHVSRNFEQALINENIPYTVFGGIRFFERKEIKDVLAYLRLVLIEDDMSFLRIVNYPKRGLGKKFVEDLSVIAEEKQMSLYKTLEQNIANKSINKKGASEFLELLDELKEKQNSIIVSDLVKYILDKTGISKEIRTDGDEARLENIQELVNSIIYLEKENDEKLELLDYLQEIALYTNKDIKEEEDGKVNLMTIHTSKGLEYPYVFLCGFTEGVLPSAMAIKDRKKRAIEEERRLTYVAITRAEKRLYITESEGFNFSIGEQKYPSRFLFEISRKLYIQKGKVNKLYFNVAKRNLAYEDAKANDKILFEKGDLVSHPIWHLGEIISVDYDKREYNVEFFEHSFIKPINFEFKSLKKEIGVTHKYEAKSYRNAKESAEITEYKPQRKTKKPTSLKESPETERKLMEVAELKSKQEAERKAKEEDEKFSNNIWNKLRKRLFRK